MPRRENVFRCVHVAVVDRSTPTASPFSYSKSCSTFRTAGGVAPAARASLGCVTLVHFLKDDTGLLALVFQHRLEHRPTSIQRALGHLRLDQFSTGHVANEDGGVASHQLRAQFVQRILALASDLGVYRLDAMLLVCPLGDAQCLFVASVPAALDALAGGRNSGLLEPQVSAGENSAS